MSTTATVLPFTGNHPQFIPPSLGAIDFGIPSAGPFSSGYKMIAFEPGKILQAQELNEIQFRMSVHQTLSMMMISNWINEIITNGTPDSFGPGWEGATPLSPSYLDFNKTGQKLNIFSSNSTLNPLTVGNNYPWYLCKANSSGLYFWLPIRTNRPIVFDTDEVLVNQYIGFNLNTTANGEYTGELVNCNTRASGTTQNPVKHPLTLKNSSACGSSRYYVRITGISVSDSPVTNEFVALAQKRSDDSFYYLNNIKVREI